MKSIGKREEQQKKPPIHVWNQDIRIFNAIKDDERENVIEREKILWTERKKRKEKN